MGEKGTNKTAVFGVFESNREREDRFYIRDETRQSRGMFSSEIAKSPDDGVKNELRASLRSWRLRVWIFQTTRFNAARVGSFLEEKSDRSRIQVRILFARSRGNYRNAHLSVPANSWNWDYPHSALLHRDDRVKRGTDIWAGYGCFRHISIKVRQTLRQMTNTYPVYVCSYNR